MQCLEFQCDTARKALKTFKMSVLVPLIGRGKEMPIRREQDKLLKLIANSSLFVGETREAARAELETSIALQQVWDEAILACANCNGVRRLA
jgi:hypothetical protein